MKLAARFGLPAGFLILLCGALPGQATQFLLPDSFTAGSGSRLPVQVKAYGQGGLGAVPWPAEDVDWLFWRIAGTQENRGTLAPTEENGSTAMVDLPRSGVALIGLDLEPRIVELPREKLLGFLRLYLGVEAGSRLPPGLDRVRIRWHRSLKTLVAVTGPDGKVFPSAVAQSKSGQRAEIRPMADPTSIATGADLPLRLYLPDPDARGVLVTARSPESGAVLRLRTRPGGLGHFRVTAKGTWTVEGHSVSFTPGDSAAHLDLFSATLSFEVNR